MRSALASDHGTLALPTIPGYRIVRVIGHGGMSTVYLGIQASLSREVAIKVMRADVLADEISRRRFENEARTIARLEHPHIVNIHEVGRTREGLPWYSMPYLAHGHLGQRRLTHDHPRIREVLEALLSALAFAHARGVIHRDVKAENVLFDESDHPLLADFGIALRRGHGTRVTLTGLAIGSTAYMAPEQARGQQVDPRSDLYSVGVLAWEMLTGQLPYQADDAVAMAVAHVQNPLPRLPPGLGHWQRFMNRALAKQPNKRFHNAEQMLAAVRLIPLRTRARPPRWRWLLDASVDVLRSHRVLVGGGLAAASITAIWLAWPLALTPTPTPPPPSTALIADPFPATPPELAPAGETPAPTEPEPPPPLPAVTPRPIRTAPTSIANQRLEQMHALLAGPAPAPARLREATDLLLAAHKADPEHLQLPAARDALMQALSMSVIAAIETGDDARAQALLRQWPRLRTALPPPRTDINTLHERIYAAISERLNTTWDLALAQRHLDTARLAGLPPRQIATLRAHVNALQPSPGWLSLHLTGKLVHASKTPVNRADFASFIEATGRAPAACRERASLLRLLAPRDWTRPGFEQSETDPVVCVSWQDASDYAAWASQRDGRRYRLLSMDETAALLTTEGITPPPEQRALAEWRSDCDHNCTRRIASGRSWRSRQELRPLPTDRGYPDVSFRLAFEPTINSTRR